MGQGVEVRRAGAVSYPQPLLTCGFETGIVALALCPQSVGPLEIQAAAVNGEPVIRGNGPVFCAASVSFAVVPALVVAGTHAGFELTE